MNEKEFDFKLEIRQLLDKITKLEDRIVELEKRELNNGIYLDGVSEGYQTYIKDTVTTKGV